MAGKVVNVLGIVVCLGVVGGSAVASADPINDTIGDAWQVLEEADAITETITGSVEDGGLPDEWEVAEGALDGQKCPGGTLTVDEPSLSGRDVTGHVNYYCPEDQITITATAKLQVLKNKRWTTLKKANGVGSGTVANANAVSTCIPGSKKYRTIGLGASVKEGSVTSDAGPKRSDRPNPEFYCPQPTIATEERP